MRNTFRLIESVPYLFKKVSIMNCQKPIKKEDLYEMMEELNSEPGIVKDEIGYAKWINTDKVICMWYPKDTIEIDILDREMTDEEYETLLREFYENFPFSEVNEYMREFAREVLGE